MKPTQLSRHRYKFACAAALTALLALTPDLSSPLLAETVRIPVGAQGADSSLRVPTLGMTMDAVEKEFGEPTTRSPARGTPPITRWEFDQFMVYFEQDMVIHSVIKRTSTP